MIRSRENLIAGSGIFLMGLGLFILPFSTSYSVAIFSCVLWMLGEILAFAIIQTLFYEHAPEGYKGKTMGVFQMLLAFANMLGPIGGTWLYQFGSGNFLWYLCGLLGLLSLLTYVKLYLLTNHKSGSTK